MNSAVTKIILSLEDSDAEFEIIDQEIIDDNEGKDLMVAPNSGKTDDKQPTVKKNIVRRFYEWIKKSIKLFVGWIRNIISKVSKIIELLISRLVAKALKQEYQLTVYYKNFKTYDDAKSVDDRGIKIYCFGLNMLFRSDIKELVQKIKNFAQSLNASGIKETFSGKVSTSEIIGEIDNETFKESYLDPTSDYMNLLKAFGSLLTLGTSFEDHDNIIRKLKESDLVYRPPKSSNGKTEFLGKIENTLTETSRCAVDIKNFLVKTCDEKWMRYIYNGSSGKLRRAIPLFKQNVEYIKTSLKIFAEQMESICLGGWEKIARRYGEFIENNRDDVKQDHLRLWFIINSLGSISASIPRVLHKIVECGLFTINNSIRPVNHS